MWCGWAKLNVLQKRWLVCRLAAALLILRRVGILSVNFSTIVDGLHGRHSLAGNVPPLGEVANFVTVYFPLKIKFLAERKREFTTEFAIAPNVC